MPDTAAGHTLTGDHVDGHTGGGKVGHVAVVDAGVPSSCLADTEPRTSHGAAQLRLEAVKGQKKAIIRHPHYHHNQSSLIYSLRFEGAQGRGYNQWTVLAVHAAPHAATRRTV